jgi:drug/metabolite transporter (DMT)-like permease
MGFYGWLSTLNACIFAAIMRINRPGLIKKVVIHKWRLALAGGGASFCAYALVIWAFTLAPIAMVAALRETSIIFVLLLGVFALKEPLDLIKMLATMITLLGVGMLRLNR